MSDRNVMPDLYTREQLERLLSVQLVSLFAEAIKEYTNGMAFNGLVRPNYFSPQKIERWDAVSRQLEREILRRIDG